MAMDESGATTQQPLWRRILSSWLFAFCFGAVIASAIWIRIYDPALLSLKPTVVNPKRPQDPHPSVPVVSPLAKSWDFDDEKLPWEPVLPLAQISEAAYSEGYELDTTLKKLGLTTISEFPLNTMYAYVASNDDTVVVAFRGTNQDELRDWLADARISSDAVKHGRIHRGFYRSTQGLLEDIVQAVKDQGGEDKQVWVTGHSLGGAMALVFTYECIVSEAIRPAGVVTFGQPLVVNGQLAQYLNTELKGRYVRFVHGGDLVPRVFPTFSHCGNLVWFVKDDYVVRRPETPALAMSKDETAPALAYSDAPPTMTQSEFEDWQKQLKDQPRRLRRLRRNATIQPAEAPAFLEDHLMPGYIHWIVTFSEREAVAPPGPMGAPAVREK
jgi:hypothetical protein